MLTVAPLVSIRVLIGCVFLCPGLLAGEAMAGKLTPVRAIIVSQTTADGVWTTGPTNARIDDRPRLAVVVVAKERRGKRTRTVYVADEHVTPLKIGRRKIRDKRRRSFADLGDVSVRWSTIEPHAWKDKDKREFHSNVSTETETWGQWVGYTKLSYFATPLGKFSSEAKARTRAAAIIPFDPEVKGKTKLGTIRYQVEVKVPGIKKTLATPGIEATDRAGILAKVHRVTIRKDDTFLGHLTGYFLVPEVFGSAGRGKRHQSDRYVGADCADVLTGAARAAGMRHIEYANVASMPKYAKTIKESFVLDADGNPAEDVKGVEVGDIIRINYGGSLEGHTPRDWDHVAVLFEDRSDPKGPDRGKANGKLDRFDLVIHMGHPRLVVEPLSGQSPATVDVLRWKKKRK